MKTKTTNKNNFFVGVCIALILVGCNKQIEFSKYISMPKNSWEKDYEVQFQFQVADTISKNNLFINLRNNNQYPFSNLFLITKLNFPNGQQIVDTLEYEMADVNGKFLGEGFTEIKENKLFYKENQRFPQLGNYTISIYQAMRKNGEVNGVSALQGITDVGFSIEKIK